MQLVWQGLRQTLTSSRLPFVFARYGAALLAALEALFFARVLGPESYGIYALVIQVVNLMLFVAAGSAAGYVYAYYKTNDEELDNTYLIGAIGQYLVGGLLVTVVLLFINPYLAVSGLLFLIYSPYFVTEPMLRVRNQFSLAVLGKALGSLITLILAIVVVLSSGHELFKRIDLDLAIGIMLVGNIIGYAGYYIMLLYLGYLQFDPRTIGRGFFQLWHWKRYWRLILSPSWLYALGTAMLTVFFYTDRLFIEQFHSPLALGVYSLAWQLSQGALLLLRSLNVVSSVRIGENLTKDYEHLRRVLRRQLGFTALAGLFTFVALLIGTIVLRWTFYQDYSGLVVVTIALNIGYMSFYVVGAITNLLFLERKFIQMAGGNAVVLMVSVIGNILVATYGWWYGVAVGISSLALVLLNVWLLYWVYKTVAEMRLAKPA